VTVTLDTNLRSALSEVLASRGDEALVTDADGNAVGVLTLDTIHELLASRAAAQPERA
jgi:CBS domain containing-hemolysin-like protein